MKCFSFGDLILVVPGRTILSDNNVKVTVVFLMGFQYRKGL